MPEYAVGIDLGTTYSTVACVDDRGAPRVLLDEAERPLTPSVVAFVGGKPIVGWDAKDEQRLGNPDSVACFKREMGVRGWVFDAAGHDWTAVELSALVLGKLKSVAEARLGRAVRDAVVTVPAYFRNPQREATIEAAKQAGLRVLQLINEPTAAAMAYGASNAGPDQNMLVYDLGGGTFDVTILRREKGRLRILGSDGNHELGGKDWDDRLLDQFTARFEKEFGVDLCADPETLAHLRVHLEERKKQLSTLETVQVTLTGGGKQATWPIDRASFAALTRDLLDSTRSLMERALNDVKLRPRDIEGVILVGGSSRMPMVGDLLQSMFGRPPLTGVNVDTAVALGAAVVAAQRSSPEKVMGLAGKVEATDVTNHSLGMIAVNADRSAYVNSIILTKNTPLPCEEKRPFQARPSRAVEVYMTQGESEGPGEVDFLGRYLLHDVPRVGQGATIIDICYRYGLSGTVEVGAKVRATGADLRVTVESLPGDVPRRFARPPPDVVAEHLHIYLAFDLSGSMSGDPLEKAQAAAQSFLHNLDLGHASVGVIGFADRSQIALLPSQNGRAIEQALAELGSMSVGGGNDDHPFRDILQDLGPRPGRRVAVVLTDGAWFCADDPVAAAKRCHAAGIDVVAVGFGGARREFLAEIASGEEASFFTGLEGLGATFDNIAQVLTESSAMDPLPSPGAPGAARLGAPAAPASPASGFLRLFGRK